MAASPTMPNTESTTALQSEMRKSRYRTEIRKIHTEYPYHKAIGKKSHRFHRSSCSYLPDEDNQRIFKSRDAAISAGYDPCEHCNP